MAASIRRRCACLCRRIARLSARTESLYFMSTTPDAFSHVRVRFAPSPTGYLHLGGLRTALYNYLFAKSRKGCFILRIEDTDQNRIVPDAVKKIEEMLQWTGMVPDEGPTQGGLYGPYVQSQRLELYRESAEQLVENKAAYRCFCTPKRLEILRKEAQRRGETPRYDNRCRDLAPAEVKAKLEAKEPYVIRLRLEKTRDPWEDLIKGWISHDVAQIEGDPVILKSDGYPTYHLANVVDDHHMQISHVLRGDEWVQSTPKHLLLFRGFGWIPPRYGHLPLIINADGTKLSKRHNDANVEHLRNQGFLPDAIISYVTTVGGGFACDTSSKTLSDLVPHFDIERVKSYYGRLDPRILGQVNRAHLARILKTQPMDLVQHLRSLLRNLFGGVSGSKSLDQEILSDDYLCRVLKWSICEDRIDTVLNLLDPQFFFLWWTPPHRKGLAKLKKLAHPRCLRELLTDLSCYLESVRSFERGDLAEVLTYHASLSSLKKNEYMHLMREVLSGLKEGPPVAEMMFVMGRENTLQRIRKTIDLLEKGH